MRIILFTFSRHFLLHKPVECKKWAVIYTNREENEVKEFIKLLLQSANSMGFRLSEPRPCVANDSRPPSYVAVLKELVPGLPQMIMTVIPNNSSPAYAVIKKCLYLDHAIPSQCMTATVLRKQKALR